jgi:hypothetical protein
MRYLLRARAAGAYVTWAARLEEVPTSGPEHPSGMDFLGSQHVYPPFTGRAALNLRLFICFDSFEGARLNRLLKKSSRQRETADSSRLRPLGMTKIKGFQRRTLRQAQGRL